MQTKFHRYSPIFLPGLDFMNVCKSLVCIDFTI